MDNTPRTGVDTPPRFIRAIAVMAFAGGALGWILIGHWTGAVGIWITLGLCVLVVAGIARLMGVET